MIMASDSIKNPRKGFVFGAVAVDNNERLMPIAVGNLHTRTHRLCGSKGRVNISCPYLQSQWQLSMTQLNPIRMFIVLPRSSKRNLLRNSIEWTQFRPLHLIKIYLPAIHSSLALHATRFPFVNVAFIEPPPFPVAYLMLSENLSPPSILLVADDVWRKGNDIVKFDGAVIM